MMNPKSAFQILGRDSSDLNLCRSDRLSVVRVGLFRMTRCLVSIGLGVIKDTSPIFSGILHVIIKYLFHTIARIRGVSEFPGFR